MFKWLALSSSALWGQVVLVATQASPAERSDNVARRLEYELIAGFEPRSLVTDKNAIDLDVQDIVKYLSSENFDLAEKIYEDGGHSHNFAAITLDSVPSDPIEAGIKLEVITETGLKIVGRAMNTVTPPNTVLNFEYQPNAIQSSFVGCQVGSLPPVEQVTEGCLPEKGFLNIAFRSGMNYTYNPSTGNKNARTLAGFSTTAQQTMVECGIDCPYALYEKYHTYYGVYQYGHKFIRSAFQLTTTQNFRRGNNNFGDLSDIARAEVIKKGIVFLNVYMYLIRDMEYAISQCNANCKPGDCQQDPGIQSWDGAVAFYTGSLEGTDGSGYGYMLYDNADKRCTNFKTCGENGNELYGTAKNNIEIMSHFTSGQIDLSFGECDQAAAHKDEISKLMLIPMIQGVLRYAWILDFQGTTVGDKEDAEGAAFAAAVLPMVHACSEEDATYIYESMQVGYNVPSFEGVKRTLERNYRCMGITCEQVGGLWDTADNTYLFKATPCGHKKTGTIIGGVFGALFGVILLTLCYLKCCRGGGKDPNFVAGELPEGSNEVQ